MGDGLGRALTGARQSSFGLLLLALATLLGGGALRASAADTLTLTGPARIETVNSHLAYAIDPDWSFIADDFVGPDAREMRPLPGPRPDFGYTTAKIWLRLRVANGTASMADWRLFMPVSFLQRLAVYRIADTGDTVETLLDLKETSPFDARPINYPQIVVPFSLEAGESATLLVSYYSLGASRHGMSIETPDSFASLARLNISKSYAFYGMMLVMLALALVALVTLRQAVFAAYAAYATSIFIYVAHADGMAFQLLWPQFPAFNSMAAAVTGSGVMVFGALFAMTFLETGRYHPVMHRVLIAAIGFVLAFDVVMWVVDPKLLNRLLVYVILVSVVIFVIAGVVAARTRFREVRFYLLAWSASLIPAVLFTARLAFGFEPAFITIFDAIRLALVLDSLLMGLAIFDRYNHLRQAAMADTLAHVQRNLALSQRLAALEESYQHVTTDARQREESVKDTVHDLRQPMHALRLSLRQMFSSDAAQATDISQLESALGYMERLVAERLADRSAAPVSSTGGSNVDESATADERRTGADDPGLHAVLRGVADMFASEASAKGLGLKLVLAAPDAAVQAYPLMRVVANLVSNAIKYTREGRVIVTLRRHGSGHRIEVHDTGPGLKGQQFEEALVRNQRLGRDLAAADGTGLGLSVVKELVATNDWQLKSCPRRRSGASICVQLPGIAGQAG